MPRRKLDDELIKDIAIYRGHGMSWRNTSLKVGIPRATLQGWIKQGKAATRNTPVKRLYDAIGEAEADVIFKSATTIIQSATETRVTKIQESEKLDRHGNVHVLTTTTKEGPSWQAALAFSKGSVKSGDSVNSTREKTLREKTLPTPKGTHKPSKNLTTLLKELKLKRKTRNNV